MADYLKTRACTWLTHQLLSGKSPESLYNHILHCEFVKAARIHRPRQHKLQEEAREEKTVRKRQNKECREIRKRSGEEGRE